MKPVSETPTEPSDYAAISLAFGSLLAGLAASSRDREPIPRAELLTLSAATFSLSRLVVHDKAESWLREPFVVEEGDDKRPKGRRLRYAVGELLTCTRCVGAWSSLALVGLRVARPREARVITAMLGTSAVNDFLQTGFTRMCAEANMAQQQADAPPREAGDDRFART